MDTDSIFYFKDDETEDKIKELNALHHKTASYVTDNYGERIYYDVFEPEKDIVAFKGLHSKCYGYITEDDELIATIAGVPARTLIGQRGDDLIYLTREEELAGITAEMKLADTEIQIKDKIAALDNLKIGAKFKTNTGTGFDTPYGSSICMLFASERFTSSNSRKERQCSSSWIQPRTTKRCPTFIFTFPNA